MKVAMRKWTWDFGILKREMPLSLSNTKTQQVINVRCTGSRNLPEQYLVWLGDESMTLSTVYISVLKQTTMIRIKKLYYLRLTRARDDGAVVQD